jgi:hypothetical protein
MTLYMVPVGRGRFELYSEAHESASDDLRRPPGFTSRIIERVRTRWREMVRAARAGQNGGGRFARWRDALICRAAERVAEQRTLWALRHGGEAIAVYPANLEERHARSILVQLLDRARRFHRRWMILDGLALLVSGALAVLPGPNLLAYYLAAGLLGHVLCWRGARQGLERTNWSSRPEPALAELGSLADLPREARAHRVAAIAERLKLRRLVAFFDRAAIPAR